MQHDGWSAKTWLEPSEDLCLKPSVGKYKRSKLTHTSSDEWTNQCLEWSLSDWELPIKISCHDNKFFEISSQKNLQARCCLVFCTVSTIHSTLCIWWHLAPNSCLRPYFLTRSKLDCWVSFQDRLMHCWYLCYVCIEVYSSLMRERNDWSDISLDVQQEKILYYNLKADVLSHLLSCSKKKGKISTFPLAAFSRLDGPIGQGLRLSTTPCTKSLSWARWTPSELQRTSVMWMILESASVSCINIRRISNKCYTAIKYVCLSLELI